MKPIAFSLSLSALLFSILYLAISQAKAETTKCWYLSRELSSQEEVVEYLNRMQVDPHGSFLVHNYRSGIRWHIIENKACYK